MTLHEYIEQQILLRYAAFDKGHQRDHAESVIQESMVLAKDLEFRGKINAPYRTQRSHFCGRISPPAAPSHGAAFFITTPQKVKIFIINQKKNKKVHFLHVNGVKKPVPFYNLDVIISVGYRVKSQRGTAFRIWATKVLKDYMLKGYAINQRLLAMYQVKIALNIG